VNIDKKSNPDFLNDYIMYMKVTKSLSDRTVQEYYFDIRLFLRYLKMMDNDLEDKVLLEEISIKDFPLERLNSVRLNDIYNYLYYISEERSNETLARSRKVSAIKGLFKYLYKNLEVIDQNPCDKIELPSVKRALPKYLELDECERLIDTVKGNDSIRDYCIIVLFINCGMRLSELVGLNISSVSFEEMRMRVLGKGNKERIVYFNARTKIHLQQYLKSRKDKNPALFVSLNKPHERLQISGVEVRLRQLGRGLKIPRIHPHKFRRTLATMAIDKGMPVEQVQKLLGHVKIDTTMRYAMVNQTNVKLSHRKYIG
jgi:site-specific recombinase XerD